MFTNGQWTFAALFLIAFVIIMIFSYRKDIGIHKRFYKGSYKVLIAFFIFIVMLFIIKIFLKR